MFFLDSQSMLLLWALHYVLSPTPVMVTQNGVKTRKKFSISDSQESFVLVGISSEEIENKLKILKLKGAPIQPCILIVGEITNVKQVYVYFDGIKYTFLNAIQAADICFKLFFVFNLKYPDASSAFYKFIESYFYAMKCTKVPKVESLIADLNALT